MSQSSTRKSLRKGRHISANLFLSSPPALFPVTGAVHAVDPCLNVFFFARASNRAFLRRGGLRGPGGRFVAHRTRVWRRGHLATRRQLTRTQDAPKRELYAEDGAFVVNALEVETVAALYLYLYGSQP